MPAVWTFGPENITGIDLSANAFWRLQLGATWAAEVPWLSLVMIYPPAPGQTTMQTRIVLARTSVPVTGKQEDVERVAQVSVSSGSLDRDLERMTEAFNLFKNSPRIKTDMLESSLRDASEILKAYWRVREWLEAGGKEQVLIDVPPYRIMLRP